VEQELQDEVLARIADLRGDADNPEAQMFRKQVYDAIVALPEDERKGLLLVHYYGFRSSRKIPTRSLRRHSAT
jgi:hypothetical protein